MSFVDLAAKRYSVRKFSDREVEEDKIELILNAGLLAPTASNMQPQRILVIQDRAARVKLRECTRYHFNAPLAMLVCYEKDAVWKNEYDGKQSGDVDASIVTTHMMLAAADIGIGSTWVMHFDPVKVRDAYHVPDTLEPVAILVMGYPAEDAVPHPFHTERKELEEIVVYNSF